MLLNSRWIGLLIVAATCVPGCGGADTGFLRLQQGGVRVGYSSHDPDASNDRWCMFPAPGGYNPPSASNPSQLVQFMYRGKEMLPALPAREPAWPGGSRRLEAAITEMVAGGSTQPSGAEPQPPKAQPYGVGRYRLEQRYGTSATYEEVGALIVEPYQGETRQHWFLFGGASNPTGPKAPYTEPDKNNTDVTTRFVYVSGEVYSVNLAAFQTSLTYNPITYRRVVLTENNF